jgi:hypothetical protein
LGSGSGGLLGLGVSFIYTPIPRASIGVLGCFYLAWVDCMGGGHMHIKVFVFFFFNSSSMKVEGLRAYDDA